MRILVYLWYLSVQMQFRLHLHMHGRPLLKNFDLSSAPGRVRTDTGVLLGDRPLLWATGAANNNLASLSFRQSRSARATGRHIQGGTGEFAFTGDAAPAVPPRRAAGPDVRACAPGVGQPTSRLRRSTWAAVTGVTSAPAVPFRPRTLLFAEALHSYSAQSFTGS